jgi:hypothetical protein
VGLCSPLLNPPPFVRGHSLGSSTKGRTCPLIPIKRFRAQKLYGPDGHISFYPMETCPRTLGLRFRGNAGCCGQEIYPNNHDIGLAIGLCSLIVMKPFVMRISDHTNHHIIIGMPISTIVSTQPTAMYRNPIQNVRIWN